MELWSLMDENRRYTGKVIERGQAIELGYYHLVVFGFIKSDDGRFLISLRTSNKTHAHTWEIPAGSSILEEDSLSSVLREVQEEVGIKLERSNAQLVKTFYRYGNNPYIADVWLFNQKITVSEITCGINEVAEVKFVTKKEMHDLAESGLFMVGMNEIIECIDLI